jgi:hypothetical protein
MFNDTELEADYAVGGTILSTQRSSEPRVFDAHSGFNTINLSSGFAHQAELKRRTEVASKVLTNRMIDFLGDNALPIYVAD